MADDDEVDANPAAEGEHGGPRLAVPSEAAAADEAAGRGWEGRRGGGGGRGGGGDGGDGQVPATAAGFRLPASEPDAAAGGSSGCGRLAAGRKGSSVGEENDGAAAALSSAAGAAYPPVPPSAAVIRRVSPRGKKPRLPPGKPDDGVAAAAAACEPAPTSAVAAAAAAAAPAVERKQGAKPRAAKRMASSSPAAAAGPRTAESKLREGNVEPRLAKRRRSVPSSPVARSNDTVPAPPAPPVRSTRARPRWHNANYLLFLALRQHPQKAVPRTELILAALALDEKISKEKGLPRVFKGKTPMNTASATLTCNTDKFFVSFRPEGSRSMWFRLAFEPADFDSAVAAYDSWVCRLVQHDWPLCFGRRILLLDDARTRAIPGLQQRIQKWDKECAEQRKAEESLNLLARGTPSRYETRARVAGSPGSPGSDKENKDKAEEGEEGDAERGVRRLEMASASSVKRQPLETADADAGSGSSFPKGDPRHYLSPFPEGMDLTREPRAEVLRLSPEVIEVFIPEPSPPTDWEQVLRVGPSTIPGAGNGLFATRPIPLGVPLGFYFGIPMTEDEYDSIKDGVGVASDYSIMYRRTVLDATDAEGRPFADPAGRLYCPFHFINEDVERRNVTFTEGIVVNQVIVFTTRAIQAGEELFVDYGKDINRHWKRCAGRDAAAAEDAPDPS